MTSPKQIHISAPGKIILFGEHSVVYGGQAVAASLDMRTHVYMTTSQQDMPEISLELPNLCDGVEFTWQVSSIHPDLIKQNDANLESILGTAGCESVQINQKLLDWITQTYPLQAGEKEEPAVRSACLAFLYLCHLTMAAYQNNQYVSIKCRVESQLYVGAGLGSSASYCTAISAGLVTLFSCTQSVRGDQLPTKMLVNMLAYIGEKIIHGNPSGLDNTLCVYGGAMLYRKPNSSSNHKTVPFTRIEGFPANLMFILTNTRQPRQTSQLVKRVSDLMERYPDIVRNIMKSIDSISDKFHQIISSKQSSVFISQTSELMNINQALLDSLGVSHAKIDTVIQTMRNKFSLCSKLTGAGGGGCVLTLVPPDIVSNDHSKQQLTIELDKLSNELQMDISLVCVGGPGVTIHNNSSDSGVQYFADG